MCQSRKWESRVIEEAKSWIGTPYHMGARIKGVGVDCGTLLTEVYYNAGVVRSRIQLEPFSKDWFLHTRTEKYLDWIDRYCRPTGDCCPGNIVLIRYGRVFAHSAIMVEGTIGIHAWKAGVEYTDISKAPLGNRKYVIYEPISD